MVWETFEIGRYCYRNTSSIMLVLEFKYSQALKIWPSQITVSIWHPFKDGNFLTFTYCCTLQTKI